MLNKAEETWPSRAKAARSQSRAAAREHVERQFQPTHQFFTPPTLKPYRKSFTLNLHFLCRLRDRLREHHTRVRRPGHALARRHRCVNACIGQMPWKWKPHAWHWFMNELSRAKSSRRGFNSQTQPKARRQI